MYPMYIHYCMIALCMCPVKQCYGSNMCMHACMHDAMICSPERFLSRTQVHFIPIRLALEIRSSQSNHGHFLVFSQMRLKESKLVSKYNLVLSTELVM